MRFGCCLPGASFVPQIGDAPKPEGDPVRTLADGVTTLFETGCDFVEMTVGSVAQLGAQDFARFERFLSKSGRRIEVFCSFVPPRIRLVGEDVNRDEIKSYLDLAVSRCKACGAQIIVFGSGGARRRPEGFDAGKADAQIMDFLGLCEKYGAKYGVDIVIEPLNDRESNMILSVNEGYELWKKAALPHVWLLADSFHMHVAGEGYGVLNKAAPALRHVHIADRDRILPGKLGEGGVDFKALFARLKSIGYTGRVSVECPFPNLREESAFCMNFARGVWNQA